MAREEPVRIAGSRYIDQLIPGLVGLGIMSTGMWGVGFSIVQARLRKVLKLLVASPMRREYLLAQIQARLMFLAPEVAVPLSFGALALGVPIRGSLAAIAVVSVVGALAFAALGLLAASRVRTFEAISGIINLVMTPMWILSGVFFPPRTFQTCFSRSSSSAPDGARRRAARGRARRRDHHRCAGRARVAFAVGGDPFGVALRLFRWR